MKLSDSDRHRTFLKARSIDAQLGDIFQNPMDITPEMLNEEITKARELMDNAKRKYNNYIMHHLGMLLCFPEKYDVGQKEDK